MQYIVSVNRLPLIRRAQILKLMVEGVSLRAISRLTGAGKNTLARLLTQYGSACAKYHDNYVHSVRVRRLQCDEIWSFIGAKAKNASPEKKAEGWGDSWTWTAIDAESKLCISYLVGGRDAGCGRAFSPAAAQAYAVLVAIFTSRASYLTASPFSRPAPCPSGGGPAALSLLGAGSSSGSLAPGCSHPDPLTARTTQ